MKIWFRTIGAAAAAIVMVGCAQVTDATKTANLIAAAQDTIQAMDDVGTFRRDSLPQMASSLSRLAELAAEATNALERAPDAPKAA